MTKSTLIRASGWALMLGAVIFSLAVFATGLSDLRSSELGIPDVLREWGLSVGLILLAVGMLGLRARYGDEAGGLGKTTLLV